MINETSVKGHIANAQELIQKTVKIPLGYELTDMQMCKHDDLVIFCFRHTRKDGVCDGLGGEHFSVSVDMDATRVLGTLHVDRRHTGTGLPDNDSAKETALRHLEAVAPDLLPRLELKWILPLREQPESPPRDSPFPMRDEHGTTRFVTGIRVKFFAADIKKWAWVIVGRNGEVVAFERDIIWNSVLGRRSTEAWLHDEYVFNERARLGDMKTAPALRSASYA
jgi:hypothetical protein